MHRNTHRPGGLVLRLLLLSLAGYVLGTRRSATAATVPTHEAGDQLATVPPEPRAVTEPRTARRRRSSTRFATASVMTVLFFAGAAFTAVGGNEVAATLEQTDAAPAATTAADPAPAEPAAPVEAAPSAAPTEEAAPAPEAAPAEPAPAPDAAPAPEAATPPADPAAQADPAPAAAPEAAPAAAAPEAAPASAPRSHAAGYVAPKRTRARVIRVHGSPWVLPKRPVTPARSPAKRAASAPVPASALQEAAESPGTAPVIWLNRVLPDPTPPSRRLDRGFARRLAATARQAGTDWALVLGVIRAQGGRSSDPAGPRELSSLAGRLAGLQGRGDWDAVLALTGRTSVADQAVALEHYNRAVGLNALVDGLQAHKADLVSRVLNDGRIEIYDGGRSDLEADRVNVRVVVLMEYLAETYGQVRVSCLISGHRLFARAGVVSAHIYGDAVDIAALGGVSIVGHQEPGGLTEKAVRSVLLLPAELQPRQVISLLGLGGPSFPLADHADHIHVGY